MGFDFSKFEELFHTNYKSLVQVSYRIVADVDVAQDLVQDVFCKFWEKQANLEINSSHKAYLLMLRSRYFSDLYDRLLLQDGQSED